MDELTFLAVDSPANHSALQGNERDQMMNAICGKRCLELSESVIPVGSWARTFAGLLIGRTDWYSRKCALTWKISGTPSNRLFFLLVPSTLPTDETEFGLLLKTPTAMDGLVVSGKKNPKSGDSGTLAQEVMSEYKPTMEKIGLLLTPTTSEPVHDLEKFKARMEKYPNGTTMPNLATQIHQLLPTPTAQQAKANASIDRGKNNLSDRVATKYEIGGKTSQLSPRFVEEMMGFPKNWTALPFQSGEAKASKDTEMP